MKQSMFGIIAGAAKAAPIPIEPIEAQESCGRPVGLAAAIRRKRAAAANATC